MTTLEVERLSRQRDDATPVLIELGKDGRFSAIYHSRVKADLIRIVERPLAMIETDGDPVSYGFGGTQPQSYGAFQRVLGRYVRTVGILDLETAIRKMRRLAVEHIGQTSAGASPMGCSPTSPCSTRDGVGLGDVPAPTSTRSAQWRVHGGPAGPSADGPARPDRLGRCNLENGYEAPGLQFRVDQTATTSRFGPYP